MDTVSPSPGAPAAPAARRGGPYRALRWLADHDAPFVESRHRTRH